MAEQITPILHEIMSVSATIEEGCYIAHVDLTDVNGQRYEADYASRENDEFGLAPIVREAVQGWIADGKSVAPYVPPTPEEIRAAMPALTARQFRLGLHANGILDGVETALNALPEPERTAARIEWEYATTIERSHSLVSTLSAGLGLTDEQIDAMWADALAL